VSSVDLAIVPRVESLTIAGFLETDASATACILAAAAIVLQNLWPSIGKRCLSNNWYVIGVLIDRIEGISLSRSVGLGVLQWGNFC